MAGEDVVDSPVLVVGDLHEWDKTDLLPLVSAVSPIPKPPWSMVAIRNHQKHGCNDPPIIFPPVDHENLHISAESPHTPGRVAHVHAVYPRISFSDSDSDSGSNSSSTFSPSDSSPAPRSPFVSARPAADVAGWFGSWTEILSSKVDGLMQFFFSAFASSRGAILSFRSAAFTAILVAFLYLRRRRRSLAGQESRDRLIGIIKERDEKINQLLDQISRMNQVLLALHRVPSP